MIDTASKRLTIKKGTPIVQTGLVTGDLVVARALSVTTLEELLSLYLSFPKQTMALFKETNWDRLSREAPRMMRYAVTRAQLEDVEKMKRAVGTGARAPSKERRSQKAALHREDVELRPGEPSDRPKIFLSGCFGPVINQGNRSTCVAFAVTAMEECLEYKRFGVQTKLSEQFLYWRCKQSDEFPNDPGTWQRIAIPQAVESGICEALIWPYNLNSVPGNEGQGPPPAGRDTAFSNSERHRPEKGTALNPNSVNDIIKILETGLPVAISVPYYPNWSNRSTDVEGHIPMPLPGEVAQQGHAMCLAGYGYDTEFLGGGYFIVRNSWGTAWAPQSPFGPGYGTIPFSYVSRYGWEAFFLT